MARYPIDAQGKLITIVIDGDMPADAVGEADGPPADGANDRWNGTVWVTELATAIERRCAEVDALRDAHFVAGMSYQQKTLQLDEIAQQRIIASGANAKFALITSASWPQNFGWIMADNTLLPLDAAGMSAMADAA